MKSFNLKEVYVDTTPLEIVQCQISAAGLIILLRFKATWTEDCVLSNILHMYNKATMGQAHSDSEQST